MLLLRRSSSPPIQQTFSRDSPSPFCAPCRGTGRFPGRSRAFCFPSGEHNFGYTSFDFFFVRFISTRGRRASVICTLFHALMHGSVSFPTFPDLTLSFIVVSSGLSLSLCVSSTFVVVTDCSRVLSLLCFPLRFPAFSCVPFERRFDCG